MSFTGDRWPGLSIVMPAYDEEANVGNAVSSALEEGERVAERLEVVVADDGSRDATAERVEEVAARDPRVRLMRHEHNRGYGAAVRTAFTAATMPYVFLTDSDRQFDLGQLREFVDPSREFPLVLGYRERRQDRWIRTWNAKAWGFLQRAVFGLAVRDIDCAFKLIRQEVLERIGPLRAEGAFVSAELLIRAKAAGFRWVERPVRHYPRTAGEQSGARLRVVVKAFREMWGLRHELPRS